MRILIAIPVFLILGGCNVSKEGNAVTIQYDQNKAENTAADIGNTAQNIGNDVKKTGEKIQNTDINVNVGSDVHTNTTTTERKSK